MTRKTILSACVAGMLLACSGVEKQAEGKLAAARAAYEQGDYASAKLLIDSIKILYPKAFGARRAGNRLLMEVELGEQERNMAYIDSMTAVKQAQLDSMLAGYVLEKDTAYQQVGRYLHPLQVVERNLHRSYLRFQVDERGALSMTSVYCGSAPIHHSAVRVTAPDGTYAETPPSQDSYETTVLGEYIEKADYTQGNDGDVIGFICLNSGKSLRVTYRGDRTYHTQLQPSDRQAAVAVSQLAGVLSAMNEMRGKREEASLKAAFIKAKMEQPQSE